MKSQEENSQDENGKKKGQTGSKKAKAKTTISKTQLKGKRKDLPEATRNMLETERQKLVSLYRDLKKSKGLQADKS